MVNRNASAELFCWDFQINAAIVLMLENILNADSVRVEAKSEDVEIVLNDSTTIYAQAKAVADPYDYSHVNDKLRDALETLNEAAANGDGNKFIYVTNSPNPFGNQHTMYSFSGNSRLSYDALPPQCKQKIQQFIADIHDERLDLDKFNVRVIPFESNDLEHRYRYIIETINCLLSKIDLYEISVGNKIMSIWQGDFFHNGSKPDTSIVISKNDMMWPLIVLIIDRASCMRYKTDLEDNEVIEINRYYDEIIKQQTANYGLISRVLSGFQEKDDKPSRFVDNYWQEYTDIVDGLELDKFTKETLIKIIMYRIITERDAINKLKQEVGI